MDELKRMICERRSYVAEPQTHVHPYAQLIIPVSGVLLVTVETRSLPQNGPMVIYLPPDAPHSFYAQSVNQFFVFDIPRTYLPPAGLIPPDCQPVDERWRAIRSLLAAEVSEGPDVNQRVADLFRYILRLFEPKTNDPSLAYLHNHYHQPITLPQLAALEHYSVSYYCEWFQKQFVMSPMMYLRRLRLAQAQVLLRETDYTLLQIAQQVGYEHHATLTRLFQAEFGTLPSEYRKQSRIAVKNER